MNFKTEVKKHVTDNSQVQRKSREQKQGTFSVARDWLDEQQLFSDQSDGVQ